MLRLIIMRHGEAESALGVSDPMRRLTAEGRRCARRVAAELAHLGWVPEVGIVSDAVRTIETQAQVAEAIPTIRWTQSAKLYLASAPATVRELVSIAAKVQTLMVVGHNPGLSDLIDRLSGDSARLDPADAALVSMDIGDWSDAFAMSGCWQLVELVRAASMPKA